MTSKGRRTTMREVALSAGVSTATVARVLQNSPRVEPHTRQRVLEAVKGLGYSPNPMASSLRTGGREGPVGLVIAGFTNVFQAGVAAGAERELRKAGLNLIIGSTDDDRFREADLAREMINRRVSALMMMSDSDSRDFLSPETSFGTPIILVGRPALGLDADVVMTADDLAVKDAANQLVDLGHTRIAALSGLLTTFRAQQRLAGFRDAMSQAGLVQDPQHIVVDLDGIEDVLTTMKRLMDKVDPPTAVMALNLGITNGVLLDRITNDRRYAFIGLDESDLSAGLGVSAIIRDPQEVGRAAASLALERGREPGRPSVTLDVAVRFVRRGSGEITVRQASPPT